MVDVPLEQQQQQPSDAAGGAPAGAAGAAGAGAGDDDARFDDEQGEQEPPEEPSELEGFLQKKGDQGLMRLWKKRFCRLYAPNEKHRALVTYFKNQKDKKA
jgi:hypothetical protein